MVFDLDGCLYVGGEAIPGARAAVEALATASWRVIAATNNSTLDAASVSERIERITGIVIPADRIVTSGLAAVRLLSDADAPVLVVGEDGLRATLRAAGVELTEDPETARCVLVGLDRGIDYDRIRRAMAAILGGARFVATNRDATFPTGDVPEPGAGAIVAAVERATGVEPTYAGKPDEPMRLAIASTLGPGRTVMVGDRLDTDIALGRAAGWETILVMTGVTHDDHDIPEDLRPDHVVASIASVPATLERLAGGSRQ